MPTRIHALLVAIVALWVVAAPLSFGAGAAAACGVERGPWTSLPAPRFPAGPQRLSDHAVDPGGAATLYVTNGAGVMRTSDGGCSWDATFSTEDVPAGLGAGDAAIHEVEATPAGGFILMSRSTGPASSPLVFRSTNDGGSWQPAEAGLPPVGRPVVLRQAPSQPSTVYLGLALDGVVDLLFASSDGGATWQPRSNFTQELGATVTDLEVDPIEPTTVWAATSRGLYRSNDGGSSFTSIPEFAGKPAGPVDVFHAGGDPASVVAARPEDGDSMLSSDGGENWSALGSPRAPDSIAHGIAAERRVMSAATSVYAYAPTILNWVDLQPPAEGIVDIEADRTAETSYVGRTSSTLQVYKGPAGVDIDFDTGGFTMPDLSLFPPGDPPPLPPATMNPRRTVVKLDPGRSTRERFVVGVPPARTPLDVYFLVDTSSSMKPFLKGMGLAMQGIINGLSESGADVQFGMAEYRDFPDAFPPRQDEPNFVYKQDQDIAPSVAGIEAALENVRPDGGGTYNAQLAALQHTATGRERDLFPPGPAGHDVPAGLQADFRNNAVKVVVLVSDSPFVTEHVQTDRGKPTAPDLPQFDEVAAQLQERGILQVGISLGKAGVFDGTGDLARMASVTGALAPAGGVDCDGDGAAEVAADGALVCQVDRSTVSDGANLVPAMVNLVEAARTRHSVGLTARGDEDVVSVETPAFDALTLASLRGLDFQVRFTCPRDAAGERFRVDLVTDGLIGGEQRAQALIVCRSIPKEIEKKRRIPPPLAAAFTPVALLPPPPPPPVTNIATHAQGQAQAQSQAQAQAQAAMAAQEQEQPQVAMVHALHQATREAMAQEARENYAFSTLRREDATGPRLAMLAATASLMSAAAGYALFRQRAQISRSSRRR